MLDAQIGSMREVVRWLIPFEQRRRLVRFARRRFARWNPAASQAASLKALSSLLERTAPQTFDIICFPIIEWDFRFQRPQQLMSQFAQAGHRVFYVSQNFREHGGLYEVSVKAPNIYEVSLFGPDRNVYTDSLSSEDVSQLLESLSALRRDLALGATAMVVQLPFWRPLVKEARARFAWPFTYDCMDYHAGFSTNHADMLGEEKDLVRSADCVLLSSPFLEKEVGREAHRSLLLRNACDYEHFAKVGEKNRSKTPKVGYYGAIAEWFDTDLLASLAERNPDWEFELVGSTFSADLSRLRGLANLSMLGEQPYAELPRWLEQVDVLILPFKRTELTEATNPVKAYEILAAGKPLVSVPIAEMVQLAPLVALASSVGEFEVEIAKALAEDDPAAIARRRAFAQENTWRKRFESLEPALRAMFPLASIVIVTYNNLELNKLCLQSLFTNTEWPNIEVIVVDNASTDGTREYLNGAASRHYNLRVILNDENRGFASANNQGLSIARGDYLVLLNNDTAVPRGWLSALIRHLAGDESIGLIGPVTNEIGNEAKVKVQYSNLTGMPAWAAGYTRQHDCEEFVIPMLAMFCVAMRRSVFEKVGMLDERFGMGMFEDDDYSRRVVVAGYEIRCTRDSFVHHVGGASFQKLPSDEYFRLFDRNRALYEEKWGEVWQPHEDQLVKAQVAPLRTQLTAILRRLQKQNVETIIFLPGEGWRNESSGTSTEAGRVAGLARALSGAGWLVFFDCTGSLRDSFLGFKQISPQLYLYRGPSGVLEQLEGAVVFARASHWSLLKRWKCPRVVYDCTPEMKTRFKQGHARMMEIAEIIISKRPFFTESDEEDARVLRLSDKESESMLELARRITDKLSLTLSSKGSPE